MVDVGEDLSLIMIRLLDLRLINFKDAERVVKISNPVYFQYKSKSSELLSVLKLESETWTFWLKFCRNELIRLLVQELPNWGLAGLYALLISFLLAESVLILSNFLSFYFMSSLLYSFFSFFFMFSLLLFLGSFILCSFLEWRLLFGEGDEDLLDIYESTLLLFSFLQLLFSLLGSDFSSSIDAYIFICSSKSFLYCERDEYRD